MNPIRPLPKQFPFIAFLLLLQFSFGQYAVEFDGVDDYIEIQDASFDGDPSGTLTYIAKLSDDGVSYVFSGGDGGGGGVDV